MIKMAKKIKEEHPEKNKIDDELEKVLMKVK